MLIDEADVFLEERSFANLERNAMVAVFLRQLEYFRGILFLTTNRVRTFDEAFQSRIHVALRYHDLTSDAKRQIWLAFLKKARAGSPFLVLPEPTADVKAAPELPNCGLSREELHELGEKKVNGRQIKNVVRTATALATSHQELIGYKHLIQVLDMMEQFDSTWVSIHATLCCVDELTLNPSLQKRDVSIDVTFTSFVANILDAI